MSQDRSITSELGFLARHAMYKTVKPYSLRFTPPESLPRQNLEIEKKEVTIHDARSLNPTLDVHGFTLTRIPTRMRYEDFRDHDKIETVYANELQSHLKNLLQAPHVRVIDYVVRRRHPEFPISTGEDYESQQPAALIHLDFSHDEAIHMLKTLCGDSAYEIMRHRWQLINLWRPLRGPVFDWPLAICDARTFDQDRDAQAADAVYPEWAYENVLVHHHPDQRWYYFHGMEESETMLFKCTDGDKLAVGGCPHGAFPNPWSESATTSSSMPRESVESRAFVMWAPIDEWPTEVGTLYGPGRRLRTGSLSSLTH
ncbi:hypothetical protein B0T19DRAFT_385213 [Cercophora scortea]|uniref:Uncharacterized protein n=1 Tax=Cercophora scortea TaxID=314031 RepID=A0AAE0IPA9_9PEZI|nr:hypothetical protein B0T19DRAFT_385213 [Cercophora scortea]